MQDGTNPSTPRHDLTPPDPRRRRRSSFPRIVLLLLLLLLMTCSGNRGGGKFSDPEGEIAVSPAPMRAHDSNVPEDDSFLRGVAAGAHLLPDQAGVDAETRKAVVLPIAEADFERANASQRGDLPLLAQGADQAAESIQHLELLVNRLSTATVVPVIVRAGRYAVKAGDLRRGGIEIRGGSDDEALVWLDSLSGASYRHDTSALRLLIDVPPDWLPAQHVGRGRQHMHAQAQSSPGALFNYETYGRSMDGGGALLSTWGELRLFGSFGVFSVTGVDRRSTRGSAGGFTRHDTVWSYSDEARALTWEAGDFVTRGSAWSSAVRLGGIQLSRDFSVRPDIITYPLLQFSGEAAIPTTVDLFVNGYHADSAEVRPGPFTFSNVPFINGAGEAVVTVTDALGRQVSTTLPFYVSGDLLQRGLVDFSLALGSPRRRYGTESFSYDGVAASGFWRYGVNDTLTFEARGEAARSLGLAGVGALARLGHLGVINMAYTGSDMDGRRGRMMAAGYRYNSRSFSLGFQHVRRSSDYADLAALDRPGSVSGSQSTSATGSVHLNRHGSLGAAYFDITGRDGSRTRLVNFSYGLPVARMASIYLSGNRELDTHEWSAALHLVAQLSGGRGSISAGVERSSERDLSWRTNYSRSVPSQGGMGWSMAVADGAGIDRYGQADLAWRNQKAELRGGVYGTDGAYTRWGSASGSVVLMDGVVLPANSIRDGFVLVSTGGQPGIPVRYENQLVGVSDAAGHVLVPWATAYYAAKYSIDPLGLPTDVEASLVEQRMAVRRGSGMRLDFPVHRVVAVRATLHDASGNPLPVGSMLSVNESRTTYVGWDGFAYLEGMQRHNTISVRLPDGASCVAHFELNDDVPDGGSRLEPLSCR